MSENKDNKSYLELKNEIIEKLKEVKSISEEIHKLSKMYSVATNGCEITHYTLFIPNSVECQWLDNVLNIYGK